MIIMLSYDYHVSCHYHIPIGSRISNPQAPTCKISQTSFLPWLCTGDMMRFWTSCILPDGLPIIAPETKTTKEHHELMLQPIQYTSTLQCPHTTAMSNWQTVRIFDLILLSWTQAHWREHSCFWDFKMEF